MPSLVDIGPVVIVKKIFFLIWSMYSTILHYYLHMEKGMAIHLNKLEPLSPKDALCQVWFKLPSGSGEEDEKFTNRWTDRETDR